MSYKRCKKCDREFLITEYSWQNKKKGIRNSKCRDCDSKRQADYYQRSKEKKNEYERNRRANDPMVRLRRAIRGNITFYFRNGYKDTSVWVDRFGCDYATLKNHMIYQFSEGMTWDNYGIHGWQIDHITPLSTATSKEDLYKLLHYTNMQPLWYVDNRRKSNT